MFAAKVFGLGVGLLAAVGCSSNLRAADSISGDIQVDPAAQRFHAGQLGKDTKFVDYRLPSAQSLDTVATPPAGYTPVTPGNGTEGLDGMKTLRIWSGTFSGKECFVALDKLASAKNYAQQSLPLDISDGREQLIRLETYCA